MGGRALGGVPPPWVPVRSMRRSGRSSRTSRVSPATFRDELSDGKDASPFVSRAPVGPIVRSPL